MLMAAAMPDRIKLAVDDVSKTFRVRGGNEMPPYVSAVLSDQDAADIYAYIASLPPPPDVKTSQPSTTEARGSDFAMARS